MPLYLSVIYVVIAAVLVYVTWRYASYTKNIVEAVNRQIEVQARASEVEAFLKVVTFMEDTRPERAFIRECINTRRAWNALSPNELEKVDRVCRAFDVLGLYDHTNLVKRRLVDVFYSVPFVVLYENYLKEYVDDVRQSDKRGPTHFWELVKFYERVKRVPSNHPASIQKDEWPEEPRR